MVLAADVCKSYDLNNFGVGAFRII